MTRTRKTTVGAATAALAVAGLLMAAVPGSAFAAPRTAGGSAHVGVVVAHDGEDGDGHGEDEDSDGVDSCEDHDDDGDGRKDTAKAEKDIDGDGRADKSDKDMDGDGVKNKRDKDRDGDGIRNALDARMTLRQQARGGRLLHPRYPPL